MSTRPPTIAVQAQVSDALSDRLQERRRAKRRLRLRAVAIVVAVVLAIAGAGYLFLWSSVFALRTSDITVTGATSYAPQEQIVAVAATDQGVPLLRVDTADLVQRVESLTGVRRAEVHRVFPTGIEIAVIAREPVALVKDSGEFLTLDTDGVELARSGVATEGLPVVRVPVDDDQTSAALEAVLTVLSALPDDIRQQTVAASAGTAHEVEITLESGAQVVWGSASDSELKASTLQVLLQVDAQVYDVSAPLNPITR